MQKYFLHLKKMWGRDYVKIFIEREKNVVVLFFYNIFYGPYKMLGGYAKIISVLEKKCVCVCGGGGGVTPKYFVDVKKSWGGGGGLG